MRLVSLSVFVLVAYSLQSSALSLQVAIEDTKAPECAAFALKSKAVVEEWYPKINEILFGPGHPVPTDSITLVFEPMKGVAYTDIQKNRIHISSAYVLKQPDDYAMVVHELTHIVQHYAKLKRDQVWLQEGIADYVRHRYFEEDIDRLGLTVDPNRDTYRTGYRVTAAFLAWLEKHKNPNVVQDLNRGCAAGNCTADLFVPSCGAGVDKLWQEFVNDLKQRTGGAAARENRE